MEDLLRQWLVVFFWEEERQEREEAGPPVHDDLCAYEDKHGVTRHRSTASSTNELWLTDISEHPTREGKLYLCAVKDAYSGRIVGYSIDSRMKASLAVNALENAVRRRANVRGCKVHSDRGSQFRSREFLGALTSHGLVGSMGRAAAGDNAAMESFFALLQKNVLDQQNWDSREELRTSIVWWIERTYHRRHGQVRLGKLTPIHCETMVNEQAAQAA